MTWPGAGATAPVRSITALSPPAGAYSAATGSIGAKVLNAAGACRSSAPRCRSRARPLSQNTTTEGCAFFAFLTPGAYTVSVTAGTGVGDQEVLVPSQATSVTVGQTASMTFNYDTAATITITGWSGSAATPATNIPIGIANTGLQPYGQYTYAAGTTTFFAGVPVPVGLHGVRRQLHRQQPDGLDTSRNRFYNNPGTSTVTVTPGGTATATIPLYDLNGQPS